MNDNELGYFYAAIPIVQNIYNEIPTMFFY